MNVELHLIQSFARGLSQAALLNWSCLNSGDWPWRTNPQPRPPDNARGQARNWQRFD